MPGPIVDWTADQRAQVEAVAKATQAAAEQMVPLAKQTPHRVVRELYEQFIAYGRAYANSVPKYTPADNDLASANVNASSALVGICNAITYGSANRSLGVTLPAPPTIQSEQTDPAEPKRFINAPTGGCDSWRQISDKFDADTAEWQRRDTSIPAAQWTPSQKALEDAARPSLTRFANEMAEIGSSSGNAVFDDFATSAAMYLRASLSAGDSYVSEDSWLSYTGFRFNLLVAVACNAESR